MDPVLVVEDHYRFECVGCGHVWKVLKEDIYAPPEVCPACGSDEWYGELSISEDSADVVDVLGIYNLWIAARLDAMGIPTTPKNILEYRKRITGGAG